MLHFLKLTGLLIGCLFSLNVSANLTNIIQNSTSKHPEKSGVYVLEQGGDALLTRGWLADQAQQTIDVQYFIWSTDNIGLIAVDSLLKAAERGVKVRVLVDDFLIDASSKDLFSLDHHPNVDIRIYNPTHSVGTSFLQSLVNFITDFRKSNQRMHNKSFTVDKQIAIVGGRNMANEYFDFGHEYNFRDRDALLVGKVTEDVSNSFEEYWTSQYAIPIARLVDNPFETTDKEAIQRQIDEYYKNLHNYAQNQENFLPSVRQLLTNNHEQILNKLANMHWVDVDFISDRPGKNKEWFNLSLGGGGDSTFALARLLESAKNNVVIQTPYLILSDEAWALFERVAKRGVKISISTNSLSSTDNLAAFSGYSNKIDDMLKLGIDVYEYRPDAKRRQDLIAELEQYDTEPPIFSLHAKSMVIDDSIVYIGTFNLDPRSENLNTEIGIVVNDQNLAKDVKQEIIQDMHADNSWNVKVDGHMSDVGLLKRVQLWLWSLLPIEAIL